MIIIQEEFSSLCKNLPGEKENRILAPRLKFFSIYIGSHNVFENFVNCIFLIQREAVFFSWVWKKSWYILLRINYNTSGEQWDHHRCRNHESKHRTVTHPHIYTQDLRQGRGELVRKRNTFFSLVLSFFEKKKRKKLCCKIFCRPTWQICKNCSRWKKHWELVVDPLIKFKILEPFFLFATAINCTEAMKMNIRV